jgi:uncharacterized protein (DUF362 family)
MEKFSRREFVKRITLGVGGIAMVQYLGGCKSPSVNPTSLKSPVAQSLSPQPDPTKGFPENPTPVADASNDAQSPTAAVASGAPYLVVARNGEPEALVRKVIGALGGMEKFVPKGASVVIKPNICVAYHSYEYAATTNPWVVGALVKLCYEAGAKTVKVMDYPFGGSPQEAYARSGIQEAVEAAGGTMDFMPGFKYVAVDIPQGVDLKKTDVFDDILKADVLINVPIAKHHSLARITLGMKNMMGVIKNRSSIHRNLGQRLADINSLIRPDLTIIDGIRVLMANGPTGGDLNDVKKQDTLIASTDVVAVDSYAAEAFFGIKGADLSYTAAAAAMGLGTTDLKGIKIEEISAAA